MAIVTKKTKAMDELAKALGWPRMPTPQEGVYFSVDGAKLVLDMMGGKKAKAEKPVKPETKADINARITERFKHLGSYTKGALGGKIRALFIQGPPGLGKSFETERMLAEYDPSGINTTIRKGKITAAALIKDLWDHREAGQILVFDDCDSVFGDDVSLNLLKAATDSTKRRRVSYVTDGAPKISEKDASIIESSFNFDGTIIFITNLDFDDMIDSGSRLAPHLQAIKDRAHYVTLGMKTRMDYMVRVEQIADQGLFHGRDKGVQKAVLGFMWKNIENLDAINARMAGKLADLAESFGDSWEGMAAQSCFKRD